MPRPVALFTALTIPAIGALAQCTLQPVATGIGVPSTSGNVLRSIWWDADGAGPQPTRLVVGGAFALVGDTIAQSAAAFEPVAGQWSALGALSSPPNSFAVLPCSPH